MPKPNIAELVQARMCADCTMIQDAADNPDCENCGAPDTIVPIYIKREDAVMADDRSSTGFTFTEIPD